MGKPHRKLRALINPERGIMKLETTNIDGVKYVVDGQDDLVAIYTAKGKHIYCIGDRISIKSLKNHEVRPYDGIITDLNRSESDLFFVVTLNDGKIQQSVSLKNIKNVFSSSESFRVRNTLFVMQSKWQVAVDDVRRRYSQIAQQKAWSALFTIDQIVELNIEIQRLKQEDYGQWDSPECQSMYNGIYNDITWAYHNMIPDHNPI